MMLVLVGCVMIVLRVFEIGLFEMFLGWLLILGLGFFWVYC